MAVSLEALEAELARQDEELAAIAEHWRDAPPELFEELEEKPRPAATPLFGIRG
jgi:hypothetical protein